MEELLNPISIAVFVLLIILVIVINILALLKKDERKQNATEAEEDATKQYFEVKNK